MIVGIGTDIIEVDRFRESHKKFGEKIIDRILLQAEKKYCLSHTDPAPHIAARFAAKEAIAKAFGTGIGESLSWHDMEITREESGKPTRLLYGTARTLFEKTGASHLHITLSHTNQHATATAVLEC